MGEFTDICNREGHNESTAGAGMRLETSENQLGADEGCFDTGIYFLAEIACCVLIFIMSIRVSNETKGQTTVQTPV